MMNTKLRDSSEASQIDVPTKPKKVTNPLQSSILKYTAQNEHMETLEPIDVPKRYTRYGSLLLLGPMFASHSDVWRKAYALLTESQKVELFSLVIQSFNDKTLTHIAINAPIAASNACEDGVQENIVRSPTGLHPVFGDFGPGLDECDAQHPSQNDLDSAYWTETTQLNRIVQVWAPRWTMFSRGNLSEKQRILHGGSSITSFPGLDESALGHEVRKTDVVDFYIGIGYFAFCYLTRGVARVWGWEINGWSVEGLRRGCIRNGWGVRVIKINKDGSVAKGSNIPDLVAEILRLQDTSDAIRCVAFWGDNKWASTILSKVRFLMNAEVRNGALQIRHCNLGLLPSSQNSWEGAVSVLDPKIGGWLHVHENVDIPSIITKQQEIIQNLEQLMVRSGRASWSATCSHVERVKTYAPGVVHCVYDIKLYTS